MKSFLSRFGSLVLFVLSGFDRLRFCGEARLLNHSGGVECYLYQQQILCKDFPKHVEQLTDTLRQETKHRFRDVPSKHLNSPEIDKEATARELAVQHGRTTGHIALITCQETAWTYRLRRDARGMVVPHRETTRCVHYYHYFLHRRFGLCYVRVQTWFPFGVRVGLNGREWLAQQLQERGVGFQRRGNLITAVDDVPLAQQLLGEQTRVPWASVLADLVRPVHPLWDYMHGPVNLPLYWMTEQSEWATDFVFRSAQQLAQWYPRWVRHGITTLQCKDVLRYLGKKVPAHGYGGCTGEAKIDLRTRAEGTRLKFWYQSNSVKMYDKEGRALRLETTINNPELFQVYRTKQGEAKDARKSWQPMRKTVADMARRAEVSQSANNRLADSLATTEEPTPLGKLLEPLGQPVIQKGQRLARALNLLAGPDRDLLCAMAQGTYLVNGFRNRDLREVLFGHQADDAIRRKQAGKITRLLGLMRVHGLIVKVNKTHRYQLSAAGKRIATALLAAQTADIHRLTDAA
jgi:hypothetical protein